MLQSIDELKEEMSKLAEQIGSEGFGFKLDYSIDSIRQVDKILGILHDEYRKTKDDDGFTGISLEFASYVVKVIEKNVRPVRWERDHPDMGENSFPLYLDESAIFPMAWCAKRLYDGPGDDIWTKFHVFVLKTDPPSESSGNGISGFLDKIFRR